MFQPLLIFYLENKILSPNKLTSTILVYHKKPKAKILFTTTSSNLILQNREARLFGTDRTVPPLQKQWAALWAAVEILEKKSISFLLEYIYNKARTHFMENE